MNGKTLPGCLPDRSTGGRKTECGKSALAAITPVPGHRGDRQLCRACVEVRERKELAHAAVFGGEAPLSPRLMVNVVPGSIALN